MASQSRDNILTQASQEKHKYPLRHYPGILSWPIRSHSPLITLYTHLNTNTHFWIYCSHSNRRGGKVGLHILPDGGALVDLLFTFLKNQGATSGIMGNVVSFGFFYSTKM